MSPRVRMIAVGVIAPLLIAAAGLIAVLVVLPALPDPVATHWGPTGAPDAFGPPVLPMILIAVIALGYAALSFAVARRELPVTANQRIIVAIAPFLATVVTVIGAGSLVMQAGLADARQSPSVVPLVIIGFLGGVLLGILGLLVLPAAAPADPLADSELPTVDLGATERAVWMRQMGPPPVLAAILGLIGVVVFVGGGVVLWLRAPVAAVVVYLAVLAVVGVAVVATLAWKVSVDGRGFIARSALGLPVYRVPLDQVEAAASVEVDPTRDFGGWGIRWGGGGRLGLILRRGEALEVRRRDGRALVVTTDDSQRAAALLNSLARRA